MLEDETSNKRKFGVIKKLRKVKAEINNLKKKQNQQIKIQLACFLKKMNKIQKGIKVNKKKKPSQQYYSRKEREMNNFRTSGMRREI